MKRNKVSINKEKGGYVCQSSKICSKEQVESFSGARNEPAWLRDIRLKASRAFRKLTIANT